MKLLISYINSTIKFFSFLVCILVLLEFTILFFDLSPAAFARPSEIGLSIPNFFLYEHGLLHVGETFSKSLLALTISFPLGIFIGLSVSNMIFFRRELKFIIDFFRSIPATALIPLLIVIFGIGDKSKIAAGVISGSLAIAIAVIVGYSNLNSVRLQVVNNLQLKGLKRIFYYELPELTPSLFIGLRTAASLCLILVVIGEMLIGSETGLGAVIADRRYSDDVPVLYLAILLTGVLGFLTNACLEIFEFQFRKIFSER